MINTLKRASRLAPWLSVAAMLATAAPAFAQAPSQAQRDAIKSQCRSDYIAHCSSVPPGGEASLQFLQKFQTRESWFRLILRGRQASYSLEHSGTNERVGGASEGTLLPEFGGLVVDRDPVQRGLRFAILD